MKQLTKKQAYRDKLKKQEPLILARFYELVLVQDPSYTRSMGQVNTTLSKLAILKLKKQAAVEVWATYDTKTAPHNDLIYDHDFMEFCTKNYKKREAVNWRQAYRLNKAVGAPAKVAARELGVSDTTIYKWVAKYEAAALKYKGERDALKHRNNDFKL